MSKYNDVNRLIPDEILDLGFSAYSNAKQLEDTLLKKNGPKIRKSNKNSKLLKSIRDAIKQSGLEDGMIISFHHHLRNGDYVLNMVLEEISSLGIKNLTLAPSSLSPCHDKVLGYIENGTITRIQSSGLRSRLGEEISNGMLDEPVIIRSHGGRARAVEDGELQIDVSFIAAPSCDIYGNISGKYGKSACGSLGYAKVDASYANCVVAITDNLVNFPNSPYSIGMENVDYIVEVDSIGDPKGIVSGAIRFGDNPKDLLIAKNAIKVVKASGLYKEDFVFQTGAAGSTLAVAKILKEDMKNDGVRASMALGGITGYMVDMLEEGLVSCLMDTQSFDLSAVESISRNLKHIEISASEYANPNIPTAAVDLLDFVFLGALEVDTDFNVNVMTTSSGIINQAVGGHQDTAEGAKLSFILTPLIRGRNPIIKDSVETICTPGDSIDVVCTEYGIAVNPKRSDLIDKLEKSKIKVMDINELKNIALGQTGIPDEIEFTDDVVGILEYRDGSVLDVIRKRK